MVSCRARLFALSQRAYVQLECLIVLALDLQLCLQLLDQQLKPHDLGAKLVNLDG